MTSSAASNSNRSSGAGLHNLVGGLTQPSPTATSNPMLSSFSSSTTSIFNNPGLRSSPSTPGSTTPANAIARVQSFATQRLSYAIDAGKNNGSAVKEVDDPTTNTHANDKSQGLHTSNRSLAAVSTQNPHGPAGRCGSYRGSDSVSLEDFLYNRGFREGVCSDITIIAFNTRYRLHRLILDRSPFFSTCFNGGPWAESESSEITLSPEATDPNIEQHAFELALARLYGHVDKEDEDKHAMPLLAAASYLRLQDLAESCVTSLLRSLKTSNIPEIIKFVTNSYYGTLTDRLVESAKALLYRDGWEMPLCEWNGISGDIVAEIAGYDGFYVPSEYHRYCFVRDLINWRIKTGYSSEEPPIDSTYMKVPEAALGESLSFEHAREEVDDGASTIADDEFDTRALRDLLENGIYYIHMSFEELQLIVEDTDVLGRPTVSESTIRDALWQQTVLRQKVLNVPNESPELGITKTEYIRKGKVPSRSPTPRQSNLVRKGILTPSCSELDLSADHGGRKPRRRYFIPIEDSSTTVIGDTGSTEQQSQGSASGRGHSRPANACDPTANLDVTRDPEFEAAEEVRYSEFPPFRFSAEFRNIRLGLTKRVYSPTVYYAGSYWNIYVQKVKSPKNIQLGVYLHRAKGREGNGGRDSDQLMSVIDTGRKSDAEDGDATLVEGDSSSTTILSRPGANTSASRSLPGSGASPPTSEISVPALGHYVDSRPMIQTYFKIFSPSRKGKMLSMFSSRPDSFNFSQSWGWKSSSLILDEGMLGGDGSDKDARLRFMVVLGNV